MVTKNILFISTEFPPGPGGIGNHAWNIARQLDKQFSIDVLTISDYVTNKECLEFDKKEIINLTKRYKRCLDKNSFEQIMKEFGS